MRRLGLALLLLGFSLAAVAHRAPNSLVRLEFLADSVRAEVLVPESELAFATAASPAQTFPAYLLNHLSAETPQGARWKVEILSVSKYRYFEHDYRRAEVVLTPPAGASARDFVLTDDAVTHEVRNHVVVVIANTRAEPEFLGALQYPKRSLTIARR